MRKKIECLDRLFALLKCKLELLEFLKQEKVMNDDEVQGLLVAHHSGHCANIVNILENAVKTEKLQLVDYEWTILPVELVKLSIVSHNTKKEFTFSV